MYIQIGTLLAGQAIILLLYQLLKGDHVVEKEGMKIDSYQNIPKRVLIGTIFAPTIEELIFRGIPLLVVSELYFLPVLVVLQVIFIMMHGLNFKKGFIWTLPYFTFTTVFLCYMAIEYGILWAILTHVTTNIMGEIRHYREFKRKSNSEYIRY